MRRWALCAVLVALVGCRDDEPSTSDVGGADVAPDATNIPFGEPCAMDAQCSTTQCGPVVDGAFICTESCSGSGQCFSGWECLPFSGETLCACTPSVEVCDAVDNDCNGILDDHEASDACPEGQTCVVGSCR